MTNNQLFVIVNPMAGRGLAGRRQAELESLLHQAGLRFTLTPTGSPTAAIGLARRAVEQGFKTVVAVGGDGTISQTAQGILQAAQDGVGSARLGTVPVGTGNDFVQMIDGAVANDLAGAVARLKRGTTRWIDVGRVNGHFFINVVGMGLDAQVTIESQKIRGLSGPIVYIVGVARALAVYHPSPMTITFGDQQLTRTALFANVANGRSHGGGFRLTPDAQFDDGQLDLCFVEQLPLAQIVRHFPKVRRGTHTTIKGVTMGRAATITVRCPSGMPLAVDGEVLASDAQLAEITTLPQALEIIC